MEYSTLSQSGDSLLPPSFQKTSSGWKSVCFWIIVAFPFLCIPILFSLYAGIDTDTDTDCNYLSSLSIDPSSPVDVTKGLAVSLLSDGQIRAGGGTSIYRNTVDMSEDCPKYLDMDAIFDSYFLVTSANGEAPGTSAMKLVHMTAANEGEVVYSAERDGDVYEVATLSQESGIFVAVEQDDSEGADEAVVFAGQVLADASKFSLGQSVQYSDDTYSMNPVISRLSDTSFVLSYYNTVDGEAVMSTRVGTVDESLQIVLTDPVVYAANTNYSVVHDAVGLGPSQYVVSYYYGGMMTNRTADPSAKVNEGGPLLAQLFEFDEEANEVVMMGSPVEYLSSSPAYYLSSANIDNSSAVLVFADRSINYGILSVLVSLDAVYGVLEFGSSLGLSTGQALGAGSSAIMDLDVVAVPPSPGTSCGGDKAACSRNSFSVLYSDATNDGEVTLVSAKVTKSLELVRSSADYVIKYVSDAPSGETSYAWGALAALSSSQVGIVTAATDGSSCSSDSSVTQLNMMEILPKPFGMVSGRDEINANVLVGGKISFSNTVPGMTYYANTMGSVLNGNMYYGEECSASEAVTYIDLQEEHDVILSLDSVVGVGVSKKKLLLTPRY